MPRIELEVSEEDYQLIIEKLIPSGRLEADLYNKIGQEHQFPCQLYIPSEGQEKKS
jgi:hypothetical protein